MLYQCTHIRTYLGDIYHNKENGNFLSYGETWNSSVPILPSKSYASKSPLICKEIKVASIEYIYK